MCVTDWFGFSVVYKVILVGTNIVIGVKLKHVCLYDSIQFMRARGRWGRNKGHHFLFVELIAFCLFKGASLVAQMVKNPPANAGDWSSIAGLGQSPREGNGSPPQYSCLENPMDREAWQATVHGVAKSWTQLKQLSTHAHTGHSKWLRNWHLVLVG